MKGQFCGELSWRFLPVPPGMVISVLRSDEGILFTRKELYDLLSERSVTWIVMQYDLDRNYFVNQCDIFDIPRRTSADWSRLSMGIDVPREPLTGNPDDVVYLEFKPPKVKTLDAPKGESKKFVFSEVDKAVVKNRKRSMGNPYFQPPRPSSEYADLRARDEKQKKAITSSSFGLQRKKDTTIKSKEPVLTYPQALKAFRDYNTDDPLYIVFGVDLVDDFRDVDISQFFLTPRSFNCLMRAGIKNLYEILSRSINKLLEVKNLGVNSVCDILSACKDYFASHPLIDDKAVIAAASALGLGSTNSENKQNNDTPFVKLMLEFYKLNEEGQAVALETITALASIEKFKAKES